MRWIFVCAGRVEWVGPPHKRKPNRAVRRPIWRKKLGSSERTPYPHTFSYVKSCLDESWSSEVGCFTCRPSSPQHRPCCADEVIYRSPSTKPDPSSLLACLNAAYNNSIAVCTKKKKKKKVKQKFQRNSRGKKTLSFNRTNVNRCT